MPTKKIYASDIKQIKSDTLAQEAGTVKVGDQELRGAKLKKYLEQKAQGGKTASSIDKGSKEEGVEYKKRQSIIDTIAGDDDKEKEKPPVAKHLRALDRGYEDEKNGSATGVSIRSIRGGGRGASRLTVDSSQKSAPQSRINPLTGGSTAIGSTGSGVNPSLTPPTPPKMPPKLAI